MDFVRTDLTIRQRRRNGIARSLGRGGLLALGSRPVPPNFSTHSKSENAIVVSHVLSQKEVFIAIPKFPDYILLAHSSYLLNAEEFVLLYDLNKSKMNPDLPCHTPPTITSISTR